MLEFELIISLKHARDVIEDWQRENLKISHKKVLRLMHESDLLCRVKRRCRKTTNSRHRYPRYPNLIKGMTISCLNQVWHTDISVPQTSAPISLP